MEYQISNGKGVSAKASSYESAKRILEGCIQALVQAGHEVARINMDVAPPSAPLGDVRPSSSGPISFGYRVEMDGVVSYVMAEPVS